MRVLQTIQGISAIGGGPSTCTHDLMEGLYDINASVDLLTVNDNGNLGQGRPWLKVVPYDYKTPLYLSRNIRNALKESDYEIYHANALWSYSSHITCKLAREKGKPYIISTHGMLYPTALAISRWKKIPMLKLWFQKDIMEASCLHATCEQEREYCRTFGYKGPIAVIPNAVVFPEGLDLKRKNYRDTKGRRQIGFLGRLHPIKKVENIIYAISILSNELRSQVSFQIMGKYDDKYEQWLKKEVVRLKLEECVEFVGFVSGKKKYECLTKLSALMVPSEQENFGMIVPEALICGTPVYASLGTPWGELNKYNAGWWKDNEPETIYEIIKDIINMTDEELIRMGRNGRKLIENKYEQHEVAKKMKQLYQWIFSGKTLELKPSFVSLL